MADICVYIMVKLNSRNDEFVDKGVLVQTVFQLGQLAVKQFGKGDKKPQTGGQGLSSKYTSVMEKVLMIILNYVSPVLGNPSVDSKLQTAMRRDLIMDVVCNVYLYDREMHVTTNTNCWKLE